MPILDAAWVPRDNARRRLRSEDAEEHKDDEDDGCGGYAQLFQGIDVTVYFYNGDGGDHADEEDYEDNEVLDPDYEPDHELPDEMWYEPGGPYGPSDYDSEDEAYDPTYNEEAQDEEEAQEDEEVQEEEEDEFDPEQGQEEVSEHYGPEGQEDDAEEYYEEVEVNWAYYEEVGMNGGQQDGHGEEGYESSSENGLL